MESFSRILRIMFGRRKIKYTVYFDLEVLSMRTSLKSVLLDFVANEKFFKNIANNVWEEKSKIHSSMLESGAKNLWKRSRESFA